MKKTMITSVLSLVLAGATFTPTFAAVDGNCEEGEVTCLEVIEKSLTINEKYSFLNEKEIFKGKSDGEAHLEDHMTRAQLAVVLDRMLELDSDRDVHFTDVKNHWAQDEITSVVAAGYMEGKDGLFNPNQTVTLEELAQVLVNVVELNTDEYASIWLPGSDWAQGYLAAALTEDLLAKSDDYMVKATRAELVYGIYRAHNLLFHNGGIVAGTLEPSLDYEKKEDGSIEFTYTVKNQTEKEQTLAFSSGQRFDYKLFKDGKEIYQYSMDKLFMLEYAEIFLAQGEELSFKDTLRDLKPGKYEIEFWLADKEQAWPDSRVRVGFEVK